MAEQVVDIRQRIEKMRTQIDDVPQSEKANFADKPELKKKSDEDIKENIDRTEKDRIIKSQSEVNNNFTDSTQPDLKSIDGTPEPQINTSNEEAKTNERETEFTKNYFKKIENLENRQKKSFSNYQLKNTTDENDKKVNFEKNKQNFPQFSLNINNPISWKLMLLIMLMQLLTNIMLVVVLYFK